MSTSQWKGNTARNQALRPNWNRQTGRNPGGRNAAPVPEENPEQLTTRTVNGRKRVATAVTAAAIATAGAYTGDGSYTATQASTDGQGTGFTATVTITSSVIASVDSVDTAGDGYNPGDIVTLAITGPTTTTAGTLRMTTAVG